MQIINKSIFCFLPKKFNSQSLYLIIRFHQTFVASWRFLILPVFTLLLTKPKKKKINKILKYWEIVEFLITLVVVSAQRIVFFNIFLIIKQAKLWYKHGVFLFIFISWSSEQRKCSLGNCAEARSLWKPQLYDFF